ncbi:hypothetical protein DFH06DRAFT_1382229 [Mycena polygramma]|nr:hypothetical protein DFH06DRAFT_1382229 [Mycena polygramma]
MPPEADFAGLSPTLRQLARLAGNGDPSALDEVLRLIRSGNPQSHRFIPAFTQVLASGIVQERQDTWDVHWGRATRALDCLASLAEIPFEYCATVWPLVWAWIQLLYANLERFPDSNDRDVSITFLLITRRLRHHARFSTTIIHTLGIEVIMGRAWVALLDEENIDGPMFKEVFSELCDFIRRWAAITRATSPDEWVAGFQSDLPSVFLKHVDRYLHAPVSATSAWFLGTAVVFLAKCRQFVDDKSGAHLPGQVVTALTNIICVLAKEKPEIQVDKTLGLSVLSLHSEFLRPHSYSTILEAVRAGILPGILLCSRHRDDVEGRASEMLELIFPGVAHYRILTELQHSLPEVRRLLSATRSVHRKTMWNDFLEILDSRLAVKKRYDSAEYVSLKACDSIAQAPDQRYMQCGKIQPKAKLLRCSSCQAHYYCGLECQSTDWKNGHRQNCAPLRLRLGAPDYLGTRTRSFLRAVLHADYIEHQAFILRAQLDYLIQHSPEAEFYTLFSYKGASMGLNVYPTSGLDPHWDYEAGRAARSEGRIEMHLLTVSEDEDEDWERFFPLQSSNGMLQAGLRRIAAETREGKKLDLDEEIKALISATADVIHVH